MSLIEQEPGLWSLLKMFLTVSTNFCPPAKKYLTGLLKDCREEAWWLDVWIWGAERETETTGCLRSWLWTEDTSRWILQKDENLVRDQIGWILGDSELSGQDFPNSKIHATQSGWFTFTFSAKVLTRGSSSTGALNIRFCYRRYFVLKDLKTFVAF